MKLFVFLPYEWAYCGGAIGITAETFEDAVDFIVEKDRKRCAKIGRSGYKPIRNYKKEYFAKSSDSFKKDRSDQWLLTNVFDIPKEKETRIAFDDWNYG